jgi:hypothetical protein
VSGDVPPFPDILLRLKQEQFYITLSVVLTRVQAVIHRPLTQGENGSNSVIFILGFRLSRVTLEWFYITVLHFYLITISPIIFQTYIFFNRICSISLHTNYTKYNRRNLQSNATIMSYNSKFKLLNFEL